jgi:signal transduction histidine kinase
LLPGVVTDELGITFVFPAERVERRKRCVGTSFPLGNALRTFMTRPCGTLFSYRAGPAPTREVSLNLIEFVEKDVDNIVAEWVKFSETMLPAARDMSPKALADHARVLLLAVVADLRTSQGDQAQDEKSRGKLPDNSPNITRTARDHASQRFAQGFSLEQMVAEYRALRASVIRRWSEQLGPVKRAALDDLTRFGETLDQGLTESLGWYSKKVEESRGLMLGVLGHDLRNPLGATHMSAQFLLRSEGLNGGQTKTVARILKSTDKMRVMVDDLLDFTRTALGLYLPIAAVMADMGELCREVVAELVAMHPDRTLVLEATGELEGCWDPARIGQLLSNLVANAVQHSPRDSTVAIHVVGQAESVNVRVHNEGLPIAADARATLFLPLRQTPKEGEEFPTGSSGLGLGLYIAKEIAVAHGGGIDVISTASQGTIFSVRLPRRPPPVKASLPAAR